MRYQSPSSGSSSAIRSQARGGITDRAPAPPVARDAGAAPARSTLAFAIIAAGCELGLLANGLLRVHWGINLALWVAALVATMLWIVYSRRLVQSDQPLLLALVAVAFAGGLALRDTAALVILNTGATLSALVLLGMAILGGPAPGVTVARARDYIHAAVLLGFRTLFGGFPLLLRDARVQALGVSPRARVALAALRGALLALPLLVVFAALFMAADANFNALVVSLIGFDFETIGSHAAVICIFAWISAGFIHGAMMEATPSPIADLDEMSIGPVEAGAVLVLLDLLFAVFIGVQAQYLFGGGAVVARTAGLTYAEYARRGFFELAFAAALVVPVLLAINLLMRRELPRHERMFRWLAGALVLLVGLVMLSAAHRMRLYQGAYGMTEDRLYASAFMVWIALVLAWFGRTVLRGSGQRFAFGAVVSGWLVLGGLNILDPDAVTARINLQRAGEGKAFDAYHATWLSADAVPVTLRALRTLDAASVQWDAPRTTAAAPSNSARCVMQDKLTAWADSAAGDWRSWNLGRARARQAARENRALIATIDCVRPPALPIVPGGAPAAGAPGGQAVPGEPAALLP